MLLFSNIKNVKIQQDYIVLNNIINYNAQLHKTACASVT